MQQVAKEFVAEGVITHVLDDRAAIGVGVGFAELFFGGSREALGDQKLELWPTGVDHGLMREDGICGTRLGGKKARKYQPDRATHSVSGPSPRPIRFRTLRMLLDNALAYGVEYDVGRTVQV